MLARQSQDKFALRFPDGLRDKVKVAAAENRRSMNAEIIVHLERIFDQPEQETAR